MYIFTSSSNATLVYSILFGAVLGIIAILDRVQYICRGERRSPLQCGVFNYSDRDVSVIALTTVVTLAGLMEIARPLLFAYVDPDVALSRGVPVLLLDNIFLILLAFAVAQSVQVVGVLLIFALLVTPSAIGQQITPNPIVAIGLSIMLAIIFTWAGLVIAYFTPYPVGFFITSLAFATYAVARSFKFVHWIVQEHDFTFRNSAIKRQSIPIYKRDAEHRFYA